MTDIYLKAPDEATLAAVLPMLRGSSGWISSSPMHALDCPIPVVQTKAVLSTDGLTVVTPAVFEPGFHANLRLDTARPDYAAIVAACTPYMVTPTHPQRVWE